MISALLLGSTVAGLASTGASASAPKTSAVARPASAATAPSGQEMPIGDLPGWRQVFTDDFTTDVPLGSFPTAVSDKWGAYQTGWKDTSDYGTYSPDKVNSIGGGILNNAIHTENGKSLVSAVTPKLPASMLYGRYSVRFRFDNLPGYKIAWMLWPDSNNGRVDGEVDFPELDLDGKVGWAFDHRTNATSSDDQAWFKVPLSAGPWHTATIEWSPNLVVFQYDGVEIGRNFVRTPSTPMHWVLQTETQLDLDTAPDPSVSGNVQVDWVSAWAWDPSTTDTSAPVVSDVAPVSGASVVGTTALSATATDNKAVIGVQFKVDGSNLGAEQTAPPYTMPWNTTLVSNGPHTVTVTARDFVGNMTSVPVSVNVNNVVDNDAPFVTSSAPVTNGTIFPVQANIYAHFSEAVTGINASSFTLTNRTTGAVIPAVVGYTLSANDSLASLNPTDNLANDTKYTLTLNNTITDRSGNALPTTSWSFVTGPAPVIVTTAPTAGATNVSRTANIVATASEDITKVSTSTATLTASNGTQVSATITYSSVTDTVTIDPVATLAANTTYTAKLTNAIKDLVGNPMSTTTWSFTTGA